MVTVVNEGPTSTKFEGGRGLMIGGWVVGLAGLAVMAILFAVNLHNPQAAKETMAAYLVGLTFWLGIAVASIIWVAIFHTAHARWPTVVRRPLEVMGALIPLFLLLCIPVLLFSGSVYEWVHPPATYTAEQLHLMAHKHAWLNMPFFTLRWASYFIVWLVMGQLLYRWSVEQDETGDVNLLRKMRNWGAGSLPFLAYSITFFGFDWVMSLDPFWGSAIFGAYFWAGSFVAAIALVTLVTVIAHGTNSFGGLITRHHMHNLGKLMFAFTCFWGYIAFSQYLLIWIANIPEEGHWYLDRMYGGWQGVSIFIILCNFVFPFCFLISRWTKFRTSTLGFIAVWILGAHLVDLIWTIMPAIHQAHWEWLSFLRCLVAFVGVGGLTLGSALWVARGRFTLPVKDPFLQDSLRYTQP